MIPTGLIRALSLLAAWVLFLMATACQEATPPPGAELAGVVEILDSPKGAPLKPWPVRFSGKPIGSMPEYRAAIRPWAQQEREPYDADRFSFPHSLEEYLLPSSKRLVIRCDPRQCFGWLDLVMRGAGLYTKPGVPVPRVFELAKEGGSVYKFSLEMGDGEAVPWEEPVWGCFRGCGAPTSVLSLVPVARRGVMTGRFVALDGGAVMYGDPIPEARLGRESYGEVVAEIDVSESGHGVLEHQTELENISRWCHARESSGDGVHLWIHRRVPIGIAVPVMETVRGIITDFTLGGADRLDELASQMTLTAHGWLEAAQSRSLSGVEGTYFIDSDGVAGESLVALCLRFSDGLLLHMSEPPAMMGLHLDGHPPTNLSWGEEGTLLTRDISAEPPFASCIGHTLISTYVLAATAIDEPWGVQLAFDSSREFFILSWCGLITGSNPPSQLGGIPLWTFPVDRQ